MNSWLKEDGMGALVAHVAGPFSLNHIPRWMSQVCGWHKCDKGGYPFRAYTKRKRMLTPVQISAKTSEYFRLVGFDLATPRNIANFGGQTDLVIAGSRCLTTSFIATRKSEMTGCLWHSRAFACSFSPMSNHKRGHQLPS